MPIYFSPPPTALPVAIESIGNQWKQKDRHRPKGYPYYHWLQTEKGEGEMVLQEKTISLPEGTGILLTPHLPHRYYAVKPNWTTSFVTFFGTLEDIFTGNALYVSATEASGYSFQGWINKIVALCEKQQVDPLRLSVDCYEFLLNLKNCSDTQDTSFHPLYQRYVMPALEEIQQNYNSELTAAKLAASLYVSEQYLSRLFTRFTGYSTYQYITQYRISRAKKLLVSQPSLEIRQVAYHVGYHDVSHFIVMFKKETGTTPLQFRHLY